MSKKILFKELHNLPPGLRKHESHKPPGITEKDGCIWNSKNRLCDFTITGIYYYTIKFPDSSRKIIVILELQKNAKITLCEVPISEVNTENIAPYLPTDYFYSVSEKIFNREFKKIILYSLFGKEPQEYQMLEQGYNRVVSSDSNNSKMIFCLGNKTINMSDDDAVINDLKMILKPYDNNANCIGTILRMINMSDTFAMLLIAVLAAFSKTLFAEDAGFTAYVYGDTSCGKTTAANFFTNIFASEDNVMSLSSEKKEIHKLSGFRHIPIVVDDLNKTASSRIRNSNEEKISAFIQKNEGIGNSIYKGINGRSNHVAFLTAEYIIKNESTINRCLLINIIEALTQSQFDFLAENQPKYIAFVIDYIEWICRNYEKVKLKAQNEFKLPATSDEQDKDKIISVSRVLNTKRILDVTLSVFKLFMTEHHKIDDKKIDKYIQNCQRAINDCIYDTSEHLKSFIENEKIGSNYVDILRDRLLNSYDSPVTNKKKDYSETLKNFRKYGVIINDYCFYYDGTYVCVRGKVLVQWLWKEMKLEEVPPLPKVIKQLKYHGILKIVGGENTSNLYINGKKPYKHYFIITDRLVEIWRECHKPYIDANLCSPYFDLKWTDEYKDPNRTFNPHPFAF